MRRALPLRCHIRWTGWLQRGCLNYISVPDLFERKEDQVTGGYSRRGESYSGEGTSNSEGGQQDAACDPKGSPCVLWVLLVEWEICLEE